MISLRTIAAAAALSGLVSLAGIGVAQAQDGLTMKPLAGISFDVGSKRAISYYEADQGACKVTLILAEPFSADIARHEIKVQAGKTEGIDAGRKIDFSCAAHAEAVSVALPVLVTQN